mmetsp:Transcript_4220/g.12907  ORF Transcript_4220/g.12907 Transcript_4220/m.12907 type:complete len:258 (-) Transcript_4220:129-902(-)
MGLASVDHVVVAVRDLEAAGAAYRELGFTVVQGGRHPPRFGSWNQLIALEDGAYIELLGFYAASPEHPWWAALHEKGGGVVDFCVESTTVERDLDRLKASGVDASELFRLSRRRPDGVELSWRCNAVRGAWQGVAPFLIQDVTPRDSRVPDSRRHANGATGLDALFVAVADLEAVRAAFDLIPEPVRNDEWRASGLSYALGTHRLVYLAPDDDRSPLRAWLDADKPKPFALSLKTAGEPRAFPPDDRTLGVRLLLVP